MSCRGAQLHLKRKQSLVTDRLFFSRKTRPCDTLPDQNKFEPQKTCISLDDNLQNLRLRRSDQAKDYLGFKVSHSKMMKGYSSQPQ